MNGDGDMKSAGAYDGERDGEGISGEETAAANPPVRSDGGGEVKKSRTHWNSSELPEFKAMAKRFLRNALLLVIAISIISFAKAYYDSRKMFAKTPFGAFNSLNALYKMQMRQVPGYIYPQIMDYSGIYLQNLPMDQRYPDNWMVLRDRNFGHIAEYWEMRPATKSISRIECLKKAFELNQSCPDTLLFQALLEYKELAKPYDTKTAANPELDYLVLDAIRKAGAIEPDNGAWHFLAAVELNHLGDWDESIKEMQLAMDAADFRVPELYPYRDLDKLAGQLFMHPKAIADGLYAVTEGELYNYEISSRIKDAYRNMAVAYAMTGDASILNLYHRCAVKNAMASGSGRSQLITAAYLIIIVADIYNEQIVDENSPEYYATMALKKKASYTAIGIVQDGDYSPANVSLNAERWEEYIDVPKLIEERKFIPAMPADEQSGQSFSGLERSKLKKYWSITKRYFARDVWLKDMLVWQFLALEYRREQAKRQFEPLLEFDYNNPLGTFEKASRLHSFKITKTDNELQSDSGAKETQEQGHN